MKVRLFVKVKIKGVLGKREKLMAGASPKKNRMFGCIHRHPRMVNLILEGKNCRRK